MLLFLVTSCLIVPIQPCMEWIPIFKKRYGKYSITASAVWVVEVEQNPKTTKRYMLLKDLSPIKLKQLLIFILNHINYPLFRQKIYMIYDFIQSSPLGALLGLESQPCYEAPGDLWVENVKPQWLTSSEWGCPLDNGPKLAMGQPNSS